MKVLNVAQDANAKKLDWYNKLTFEAGGKYTDAKMGSPPSIDKREGPT